MSVIELSPALVETLRLAELAPCIDDPMWTSDDWMDLQEAAYLCRGCPALVPCREAGQGEWGVWGGVIGERRQYFATRKKKHD